MKVLRLLKKGKIFVVGGFDGQTRHYSMESYNEETDTWSLLDSTTVSREGACLLSYNNGLYCIGEAISYLCTMSIVHHFA
jgi:hypothetical protein